MARFRTVKDRKLSLWQSAAAEAARKHIPFQSNADLAEQQSTHTLSHPLLIAATEHVAQVEQAQGQKLMFAADVHSNPADSAVYLSQLALDIATAQVEGDEALAAELEKEFRRFSSEDLAGWATCITVFVKYYREYKKPLYRDWKQSGSNNPAYGVIDYKLPNNAKVAIIGDWATGMDDAKELVKHIIQYQNPDAIIHLGDIYYSGTEEECTNTFTRIFDQIFKETGKDRIPVFTIPGNHDYYAFGAGYYSKVIDVVNRKNPAWQQEASYFCLRTADNSWQFLGMDTGRNDYNPTNDFDPTYNGPWLEPSEAEWHKDKLRHFQGSTILLSHHQLFSQHSAIQNRWTQRPWLNESLFETFSPYFNKVAAWYWGHEHNLAMFQNGLMGLRKGRLVGASAYEEMLGENPYAPKDRIYEANVPYIENMPRLTSKDGYYHHAYAILDFDRSSKDDPIACIYYEFPSWGAQRPEIIQAKQLYREEIHMIRPEPEKPKEAVKSGDKVVLRNQAGSYISRFKSGGFPSYYKFPTASATEKVILELHLHEVDYNQPELKDSSHIRIETTELKSGNVLGGWKDRHELYYYDKNTDKQKQYWRIGKTDTSSSILHYGDTVYLYSLYWEDQRICQEGEWLTSKVDTKDVWTVLKP